MFIRRLVYAVFTLLAIVGSNVGLALAVGLPVERFAIGCGLIALTGACVAWWMSRDIATWGMLVRPIDELPDTATTAAIKTAVETFCGTLGLRQSPEIGFYESEEVNAFAIGRTRRRSMLAVSTGLLRKLTPAQRDAVLAHELAYIASGDAITFPLIYGQVQAFTLFPARMLALLLGTALRTAEEETPSDPVETLVVAILEICITPVASLLARQFQRAALSRADQKAATILGPETVVETLRALHESVGHNINRDKFCAPLKISAVAPLGISLLGFHLPSLVRQRRILRK